MDKLTSRKFWICVAAALASLGTGIGGIVAGNQTLAIIGSVCTVASAAIYAFCEAWVDARAVSVDNDFIETLAQAYNDLNGSTDEEE